MVFKRNGGFFLTLDDAAAPVRLTPEGDSASQPVSVSPQQASLQASPSPQAEARLELAQQSSAPQAAPESKSTSAAMTTAEAIAAELAATEAARPAVTYTTFAPANLSPGSALRQRNRKPGAALAGFRDIAQDLFKS